MIQPLVFPPKEEPFPPWLPVSDTRKFEEEQSETRDNTSHAKKETYTQIKWKSSLLNKEFLEKKNTKKFAIGLKRQISAENRFWNNGNSTRLLNSFPPNGRGDTRVEPEDVWVQLPLHADALLFIHPSNYSLRNLNFEDTKDRPYLSPSSIDLIERKCGCSGNSI